MVLPWLAQVGVVSAQACTRSNWKITMPDPPLPAAPLLNK